MLPRIIGDSKRRQSDRKSPCKFRFQRKKITKKLGKNKHETKSFSHQILLSSKWLSINITKIKIMVVIMH